MKEKIISACGIVLVTVMLFVSVRYLQKTSQNVSSSPQTDEPPVVQEEQKMQDGSPDEISKKMAKQLTDYTKEEWQVEPEGEVKPEQVVSMGKAIRGGDFSFLVDSWEITKKRPPYPRDEESIPKEWLGLEMNENGDILNDFSYVVVNMTVENLTDAPVTDYVWGDIRFRELGAEYGNTSNTPEILYWGENPPRGKIKSAYLETIPANGKVEKPLIFIRQDRFLEGRQKYLEINLAGVTGSFRPFRFILLN